MIHLSEVLEHVPVAVNICKKSYNLLSDGGIICVAVPNDYNPFQKALREKLAFEPYWLAPPHHINHFTCTKLVIGWDWMLMMLAISKLIIKRDSYNLE